MFVFGGSSAAVTLFLTFSTFLGSSRSLGFLGFRGLGLAGLQGFWPISFLGLLGAGGFVLLYLLVHMRRLWLSVALVLQVLSNHQTVSLTFVPSRITWGLIAVCFELVFAEL